MTTLLILTPRFPYPVVGGDRLRIYQLCKELARTHDLTLLSLCENDAEMQMPVPQDGVFARVERIKLPRWRSWLNCLLALPKTTPLQIAYYRDKRFSSRARVLMAEHDATIAHLIRVGDAIKDAPGVKFLEMTDAISLNYTRIRLSGSSFRDLRARVFSLEARRLRRYEESVVDSFEHSFLVSDIDRQFLFGDAPARLRRVSVSSNGVDLGNMPYQFAADGTDIIFIGNMLSLQNYDAAWFMAHDVLPLVRQRLPAVRLRLIGRIKHEHAATLTALDGVDVTGEVPHIPSAARQGGVGVCPLRLGAGVQNKVLEYMALGLPVVSTTIGLEGFEARPGEELLVADDAPTLAQKIIEVIQDRSTAERLARAARRYVESSHSWAAMLEPVVRIVGGVVQTRSS